ncbi:hypothetical protein CP965_05150 [Halarcobacter mediterraneus]|uniref:Porin domain-containing protein n=1 Tax=Halarcobacter mediterraneus TaxID=2023153 RepID=A0A4Q1AUW1_9BACT|nr:porin [Halarcobacter mediterraneus]RXK13186.1 hypothetical protein CP965_05150 [Halarcobacter mediterraneus]
MKKLGLLSLLTSVVLTSMNAGELDLISDLKVSGDVRVRGVSVEGDSSAGLNMDKQEFESRLRLNLDFTVDEVVKIHTRIVADNNAWGNNDNDEFTWDEAYVTVPFNENKFLLAGRIEDSYGTKFYGSNGDPIDLAYVGYNPRPDILLYAFDYKAVEGSVTNQSSSLGISGTGDGDFDAYSVGGQITIDEMLLGGRYVYLQNNTEVPDGFADANSHMFNAFALGKYSGFEIQAQVEKRTGDKYSSGIVDEKMFGAYLNVARNFGPLKVGIAALTTEEGYVSGPDLPVSYLTNDDLGMAALGRVGFYGDTRLFALNLGYKMNKDLTLEGNLAHHSIDDMGFNNINEDIKITEYNLGVSYKLTKHTNVTLRYAKGNFDEDNLKDIETIVAAVEINF